MTNEEKRDLQWQVRYLLGDGKTNGVIVSQLMRRGFKKATIKQYIKAFSK